jgi:hypothetical protein
MIRCFNYGRKHYNTITAEEYVDSIEYITCEECGKMVMQDQEAISTGGARNMKFFHSGCHIKWESRNNTPVVPNFDGISQQELFEHIEVKMVHHKEVRTPSLFEIPKRPTKGICSDCGSVNGKNPGIFKYRLVNIETKEVIFEKIISGNCTNNLAELLGAVHAIGYNTANYLNLPVYTDSQTALSWIRKKLIKTKHIVTDAELQEELDIALKYIKTLSKAEHPLLWNTVAWGQIDADYGAKK